MRAKIILLWAMVAAICTSAQTDWDLLQTPYHPYRQVGNKYYSLQPIYDWMNLPTSDRTARPMQEWFGQPEYRMYNLIFRVEQVLPEGLLLTSSGEYLRGIERADFDSHNPIFLKNYPYKNLLVDGQIIRFLAIKIGNYQYTATDGAVHTVALYDYGVPCDSDTPPPPHLTPEQIKAAQEAARIRAIADQKRAMQGQTNAVRWLQPQATNGDVSAQYSLGLHYLNGQGCETNREQAIYWLQKAAAQGNLEASNKLVSLQK